MDEILRVKIVHAVQEHWNAGRLLQAGMILYERIPRWDRPAWGADVLSLAQSRVFLLPEVETVIAFARNPAYWGEGLGEKQEEAHRVFDTVREHRLQQENAGRLQEALLSLAENVAKVTYNVYGYAAPFDHDAGWHIAGNAKVIAEEVGDPGFASEVWVSLCREQYINLDQPVRCNPFCAGCGLLFAFEIS